MPTENPKISAYVPQIVFDKVEGFRRQRNLSMSQAAIVIFAEYFGIEQAVKEFTEGIVVGGVTLNRIEEIENSIEQLTLLLHEKNSLSDESDSSLLSRLDLVTEKMPRLEERLDQLEYWKNESIQEIKTHKPQTELLGSSLSKPLALDIDKSQQEEESLLEQKNDLPSKLSEDILSEPFNLLETPINESQFVNNTIEQSTLLSESLSKPLENFNTNEEEVLEDINEQSQLQLISKSLSEPLINIAPINNKTLVKRLGTSETTFKRRKVDKTLEEFSAWIKENDPDSIGWLPNTEGRGWLPESNVSSELLSRLQIWIEENLKGE